MTLALSDPPCIAPATDPHARVTVLSSHQYQDRANAVYLDAELLLSAILPDARIAHVGASAVPGACSTGNVDLCLAVAADAFGEALGVLGEAGFTIRPGALRNRQLCTLEAPETDLPLTVHLVETGSRFEFFVRLRDLLAQDPALLRRYNAIKREAAPRGDAAYRAAKTAFIEQALG